MLEDKRVIILCGHYGSGKTNIALNLALALKAEYPNVALADMDIVNPYYRSSRGAAVLADAGVRLICSGLANSNVDVPALPAQLYAVADDKDCRFVVDVGGDDRGALALGRLSKALTDENDYGMLFVVNKYRPLTQTPHDAVAIMREIEKACGLKFAAIADNPNLGGETTEQTVLESAEYANRLSELTGLPVALTAVKEDLAAALCGKIPDLFPLKIY